MDGWLRLRNIFGAGVDGVAGVGQCVLVNPIELKRVRKLIRQSSLPHSMTCILTDRSTTAPLLHFDEVLLLGFGDEIDGVLPGVCRRRQGFVIGDVVLLLKRIERIALSFSHLCVCGCMLL